MESGREMLELHGSRRFFLPPRARAGQPQPGVLFSKVETFPVPVMHTGSLLRHVFLSSQDWLRNLQGLMQFQDSKSRACTRV